MWKYFPGFVKLIAVLVIVTEGWAHYREVMDVLCSPRAARTPAICQFSKAIT